MQITAIKQQVKNPERASIFVDGKYSFSLSLNELVIEKLKINHELNEAELKRLKKLSDDGKLKMRALEWTLSRPRSKRELRDYLYRKKTEPEQVEALTEEFTTRGYMSEQHYALWLSDMRRRQGKSERAIRSELSSKGITREVADETLQEGKDELSRLQTIISKKMKLPRYKADQQKLMQYLARQGFGYDDIKTVLRKITDT
ncbi:MAG: RecX family transcriptional regulator [bacterium]|nr:RecX family transcriptional regulator [bacterium]